MNLPRRRKADGSAPLSIGGPRLTAADFGYDDPEDHVEPTPAPEPLFDLGDLGALAIAAGVIVTFWIAAFSAGAAVGLFETGKRIASGGF